MFSFSSLTSLYFVQCQPILILKEQATAKHSSNLYFILKELSTPFTETLNDDNFLGVIMKPGKNNQLQFPAFTKESWKQNTTWLLLPNQQLLANIRTLY